MDSIFLHALHSLPQCLDLSDLTVRIVAYIIESNTYAKIWVSFCLIVNHFQPLIYSEFSLLALNLSTFQKIPNNLNSHKFNTFKWASGRAKNESFDFHSIAWKIEGKIKKPTKTVLFICILVNVDELKVQFFLDGTQKPKAICSIKVNSIQSIPSTIQNCSSMEQSIHSLNYIWKFGISYTQCVRPYYVSVLALIRLLPHSFGNHGDIICYFVFWFAFSLHGWCATHRRISGVHKTMDSFSNLHNVLSIECFAMDSVQHHCKCCREVNKYFPLVTFIHLFTSI